MFFIFLFFKRDHEFSQIPTISSQTQQKDVLIEKAPLEKLEDQKVDLKLSEKLNLLSTDSINSENKSHLISKVIENEPKELIKKEVIMGSFDSPSNKKPQLVDSNKSNKKRTREESEDQHINSKANKYSSPKNISSFDYKRNQKGFKKSGLLDNWICINKTDAKAFDKVVDENDGDAIEEEDEPLELMKKNINESILDDFEDDFRENFKSPKKRANYSVKSEDKTIELDSSIEELDFIDNEPREQKISKGFSRKNKLNFNNLNGF